jgi:hypothetical protein
MKARIIKRTLVDGQIRYVIQQKHFLFRWWWVDAWLNSPSGANCCDSFRNLVDAQRNLCYFDGTQVKEEVVS